MKKFSLVSLALLAGVSMFGAKKGPEVSKIEPPYWWVGMANDTLQLMVYGTDIAKATASVDYPGVHIAESVSLDSPNYKLLYLTIDSDTKPGKMPLTFDLSGRKTKTDYELRRRDKQGGGI